MNKELLKQTIGLYCSEPDANDLYNDILRIVSSNDGKCFICDENLQKRLCDKCDENFSIILKNNTIKLMQK